MMALTMLAAHLPLHFLASIDRRDQSPRAVKIYMLCILELSIRAANVRLPLGLQQTGIGLCRARLGSVELGAARVGQLSSKLL